MSTFTIIKDLVVNPSENGAIIVVDTYDGYDAPTNYNVVITQIDVLKA